jgi:hypothetical protein
MRSRKRICGGTTPIVIASTDRRWRNPGDLHRS